MRRILFGVALLIWSAAAWSAPPPCCSVAAIDARTGVVSIKDVKTGKVSQYKAEPMGIKGLKVGDMVDLVGGQLRTAAGAAIAGRVQPDPPRAPAPGRSQNFSGSLKRESPLRPAPGGAKAACYVGGCSGEVCSDRGDVITTCSYQPYFACFKTAECKPQPSGQCGWTQTPALTQCLSKPPSN